MLFVSQKGHAILVAAREYSGRGVILSSEFITGKVSNPSIMVITTGVVVAFRVEKLRHSEAGYGAERGENLI